MRRLKRWVETVLWIMVGALAICLMYMVLRPTPETEKGIETCIKHGSSRRQCEREIYGDY